MGNGNLCNTNGDTYLKSERELYAEQQMRVQKPLAHVFEMDIQNDAVARYAAREYANHWSDLEGKKAATELNRVLDEIEDNDGVKCTKHWTLQSVELGDLHLRIDDGDLIKKLIRFGEMGYSEVYKHDGFNTVRTVELIKQLQRIADNYIHTIAKKL